METRGGSTLQFLLCIFWLATILPAAAAAVLPIITATGGRTFRRLICTLLARGKTVSIRASSSSRFTIPQKYFLHFYAMGVAVTTSLLLAVWFYAYMKMTQLVSKSSNYSTIASHHVGGSNSFSLSNVLPSHPLEHIPTAQMHILLYLGSLSYYVAAPLTLASPCLPEAMQYLRYQIDEFIVKDQARMPDLVIDPSNLMRPLLKLGWSEWIGAAIFMWGSLHQFRCHAILGSLRKLKDSDEYVIPCGDWFNRVSCPHYLAEIVIYFGLLIASGGSYIPLWFMLLIVIMNLSFSAVQTHKWYLQKFEDYPRSRYALIPYVC
ncbi:unnamed protein product [Urochloa humidicola]